MRLSIAVMTHNESAELRCLIDTLQPLLAREDVEVVIVDDFSGPEMQATFSDLGLAIHSRSLNGDFAAQRNYSKQLCRGDYILFLDPDEIPSPTVCSKLMNLCDQMERNQVSLCAFPRMNIHLEEIDLGPQHLRDMSRSYDWDQPDYQTRLCRNLPHIHWKYTVHEKLVGDERCYQLASNYNNCLIHAKTKKKQASQNHLYDKIDPMSVRNLAKRLKLRRIAVWLGLLREPIWLPLSLE